MRRYDHKVALVTGAATGIGRATAWRLAEEGAKVALLDINESGMADTAAGIRERGGSVLPLKVDISKPEEIRNAVAEVNHQLGPIDVLVSNAGVLIIGETHAIGVDIWDKTFAINVRGAFALLNAVLPSMRERGRGVISITASTSGLVGESGTAAYGPSKAALINLTKQVAVENAPFGVRCNCVCPGWIDTPFNDPAFSTTEERQAVVRRQVPLGREGRPAEIAAAIAFLCSEEASYITGHALVVDGGITLGPH